MWVENFIRLCQKNYPEGSKCGPLTKTSIFFVWVRHGDTESKFVWTLATLERKENWISSPWRIWQPVLLAGKGPRVKSSLDSSCLFATMTVVSLRRVYINWKVQLPLDCRAVLCVRMGLKLHMSQAYRAWRARCTFLLEVNLPFRLQFQK